MSKNLYFSLLLTGLFLGSCQQPSPTHKESVTSSFRAPAYPLITIDPYTSAWSETDQLFDSPVRHWTGKTHSLIGAIRVDGKVYRFMGKEDVPLKTLVPMAGEANWEGKFTTAAPAKSWENPDFNDKSWKTGKAAFGTSGMKAIGTEWNTKEIWVRREFTTPEIASGANLYLSYSHDDDFELYLNGTEIVNTGHSAKSDVLVKIDPALLRKDGKNILAAHCANTGGLAYVDFGLYTEGDQKEVFAQTAVQDSVSLSATQTHYTFTCGPVNLNVQFVSPLLPTDLNLLSRPVNYINYQVASNDGAKHEVQLYFEITPQWAVNDISQEVKVSKGETGNIDFIKAGTTQQPILQKKGDNLRIDWGYVYLAASKSENSSISLGNYFDTKTAFAENGKVASGENELTTKMNQSMPAMACVESLGEVSQKPSGGYLMIGDDDVESIQYFGTNLKAWWTNNGAVTFDQALQAASNEHDQVMDRCADFDNQLWKETLAAGGKNYADLCVLAFRQSIAAHKLVKDTTGNILFLSKENFSNGSIGTVDVTYPSAPLFLKYNPDLLKGMLNPIFYFSESGKWTKPFAAHDVGTYPQANGQTYGGDMPVEECGNMIILTTAIAHMEGNADYAAKHWEVLTTWANYLLEKAWTRKTSCAPTICRALCAQHQLSVKAIMGIAGLASWPGCWVKPTFRKNTQRQQKKMAANG